MKLPDDIQQAILFYAFLSEQGGTHAEQVQDFLKKSGFGWKAGIQTIRTFNRLSHDILESWCRKYLEAESIHDALLRLEKCLFVEFNGRYIPVSEWLGASRFHSEVLHHVFVRINHQDRNLLPWIYAVVSPVNGVADVRSYLRCHDDQVYYQSWLDGSEWPVDDMEILHALAQNMMRWRFMDVAVYLYRMLDAKVPEGTFRNRLFASLCRLGVEHYHQGRYPAAARVFEEALAMRGDLLPLYHNLAMTYIKLGKYDQARAILSEAIQKHGPNPRAYEILGDLAVRREDYQQAIRFYERVLELDPHRESVRDKLKRLMNLRRDWGRKDQPTKQDEEREKSQDLPEGILEPFRLDHPLPVLGREREIQQIMEILQGRYKPSALIVGEAGVGKTALIREALRRLYRMNPTLRIVRLKIGALVAGAKYRGQLEERVQKLSEYLSRSPHLLVIEDLHQIVPSATGRAIAQETSVFLREQLLEGELRVVATTTPDEYRNVIEKDASILRCFQVVRVEELGPAIIRQILEHYRNLVFKAHPERRNLTVDARIVQQIPSLVELYLRGRAMPDRAIEVLDRTISHAIMKGQKEVTLEDLYETVAEMAGIPLAYVRNQAMMDWRALRHALRARILGQDQAIERVLRVLKASTSGLRFHPERPRGVFLFVGPSGVGKTEFAQALAECWMGSVDRMIRIDMSEYMERYSVSRLIGASPGYVGYYDANQLVDRVRQMPFSLILLDEIEKADPQLLQIFLQVFDAGRLTDGRGRTAYFNNTVIIMTSNIGTHLYGREPMGYRQGQNSQEANVLREVKKWLPPEFLNRIDDIIVFSPLSREAARAIVRLKLTHIARQLRELNKTLHYDTSVVDWFVHHGFHPEFGARNLERTIEKHLVASVTEVRETEEWHRAHGIRVTVLDDQIHIGLIMADHLAEPHEAEWGENPIDRGFEASLDDSDG